jgi:hypothetical protein
MPSAALQEPAPVRCTNPLSEEQKIPPRLSVPRNFVRRRKMFQNVLLPSGVN